MAQDSKSFLVENTGILPIKWKLSGIDTVDKDFKELSIFPAAGELAARTSTRVSVEFTALTKRVLEVEVQVEVSDMSGTHQLAGFPVKVSAWALVFPAALLFPSA